MLLRQAALDGIRTGRITLAFRRWQRPTVRAGGTLLTAIGQLSIDAVDVVSAAAITSGEAQAAGYPDLESLLAELSARPGEIYRITVGRLGPDPRIALRALAPGLAELATVQARLDRLDARAPVPWTRQVLRLIQERPAVRAVDLATAMGMAREPFKIHVRKLKALGLTESLEVGYRLSPRGDAVLAAGRE